MARPKKEGLEYFPHDVDLSGDEKVEALEAHYGLEGYAVYLKLLERIYRGGGHLELTEDLKLVLGKKWGLNGTRLDELISYSVQIKLFSFENSILTSRGVQKRLKVVTAKRLKWRKKKGHEKFSPEKTLGKPGENPTKESKVKERKVKESKEEDKSALQGSAPKGQLTDEEFIQRLKYNPAYKHIDVDRELAKMDAWFLTERSRGRKKTRRFIVNWLGKIEGPVDIRSIDDRMRTCSEDQL